MRDFRFSKFSARQVYWGVHVNTLIFSLKKQHLAYLERELIKRDQVVGLNQMAG